MNQRTKMKHGSRKMLDERNKREKLMRASRTTCRRMLSTYNTVTSIPDRLVTRLSHTSAIPPRNEGLFQAAVSRTQFKVPKEIAADATALMVTTREGIPNYSKPCLPLAATWVQSHPVNKIELNAYHFNLPLEYH